jgi:hypothetical protein
MAKSPAAAAATEVAVVEPKSTALSTMTEFEAYAGMGLEEVRSEDIAIPFLRVLAQLSPQVNKRDGKYVQGAEPGMLFNSVSGELFDGEKGVLVLPCYYNRRYVEWKPREKGGGYVSSYDIDNPIAQRTTRNERGEDILPNGNMLTNTAQFFVLVLTDEGPQQALVTMTSTQLKKARKWLGIIRSQIMRGASGNAFVAPMMANVYRLRTVEERNDKGTWFGFDVAKERQINLEDDMDHSLFSMAMELSKSVRSGAISIKETDIDSATGHAPAGGGAQHPDDDIPF